MTAFVGRLILNSHNHPIGFRLYEDTTDNKKSRKPISRTREMHRNF